MNLGLPAARLAAPAQAREVLFPVDALARVERLGGFEQLHLKLRERPDRDLLQPFFFFQQPQPVTQDFARGLVITVLDSRP